MDTSKIRRAWVISDLHFGVHSSNIDWIDTTRKYFDNFFFPTLKEQYIPGDGCFILGDVFENRQSINILVMNEAHSVISRIAEIMPVIIIVGNHDCYKKNSTDKNSLVIFKDIDNVEIVEEQKSFNFAFERNGLFIPWVENKDEMQETLKNSPHYDYLFVHEDFLGMKSNSKTVVPGGIPYAVVNNFDFVYSGHIHYGQKVKNVTMVGSPFQTSRSDMDNEKYIYLLDFENKTEERFVNNYSPKFLKFDLDYAKSLKEDELKKLVENNFVDIVVDTTKVKDFDYEDFANDLNESKKIEFFPTASETDEEELVVDVNMTNEDLIDDYVNKLSYNEAIKDKLKNVAKSILKKAQE